MKYRLTQDHYSHGKDKTCYGLKGDIVTMITESETACVVENKSGNRYPIHKTSLEAI